MDSHLQLRSIQEDVLYSILAELLLMTAQQNVQKSQMMENPEGPDAISAWLANDIFMLKVDKIIKNLLKQASQQKRELINMFITQCHKHCTCPHNQSVGLVTYSPS